TELGHKRQSVRDSKSERREREREGPERGCVGRGRGTERVHERHNVRESESERLGSEGLRRVKGDGLSELDWGVWEERTRWPGVGRGSRSQRGGQSEGDVREREWEGKGGE